jgi:hypothetical protein
MNTNIIGRDILESWDGIKDKHDLKSNDTARFLCENLIEYCDTLQELNDHQRANLKVFIWGLPKTFRVYLWQRLAREGNVRLTFIRSMHSAVSAAICDSFGVPHGPAGVGVAPTHDQDVQNYFDSGVLPK